MFADFAALGAALCWALSSFISLEPTRSLGAIGYSRIRMSIVFIIMFVLCSFLGLWESIALSHLPLLFLSGAVGIFIGDTALFATLRRLGPRRSGILFAMNAPMTVVLSWLFLEETLSFFTALGCGLVLTGVMMAIVLGGSRHKTSHFESVKGRLWVGISIGLLAALGQSIGLLLAKPVLDSGADPFAATAIRVGVSAALFQLTLLLPHSMFRQESPLTKRLLFKTVSAGLLGMMVGMSLLFYAFRQGDVGVAAVLSSTSPVLVLPILWLMTRQVPALGAWLGAIITLGGTSLIIIY